MTQRKRIAQWLFCSFSVLHGKHSTRGSRNATTTRLLLRSYARNQGAQATIGTIVADMMANDENEISVKTASSYFSYCRKDGVYVVPIGCLKD